PPFAPRPLRRFFAPMRVLTSCLVQRRWQDLPDSLHLSFLVVLSPTTRCPPMAAFSTLVLFAFWALQAGPFPICTHPVSGLRHSNAGSPGHQAESSSSRTDQQGRLPLLSTPPSAPRLRRRSYGRLSTSQAFG